MNDHATMSPAGASVPPAGGNRPEPADDFEVLLITGMSGAGRSHAADCVEDMGWYVVDNLPPKLLVPLVDMMTNAGKDGVHKLAAVIDVRSREYFDDLSAVLSHLDDLGVRARILFLDASDEVLIKRYESKLYEAMLGSGPSTVAVHIFSFGFKYGLPMDADFVADVRFLPNPFWVPTLRELNGQDKPVSDYVLSSPGAGDFLDAYERAILVALEGYAHEDKHFVTIAIGCTGGQHRSVVMSEELARRLRAHGISVTVSARELHRARA